MYRLVIDSNLWISCFIGTRAKTQLDIILYDARCKLLYSSALLKEIREVLARPKFSKYITPEQASELINLLVMRGELIEVSSEIMLSRDAKDDFLLGLSKDGRADYLISGDSDLLVIGQYEGTEIVSMRDFLAFL